MIDRLLRSKRVQAAGMILFIVTLWAVALAGAAWVGYKIGTAWR